MDGWRRLRELATKVGPRARDVLVVTVGGLVVLAQSLSLRDGHAAVAVGALVVGMASVATMWWRRRAPVLVTAVGVVAMVATMVPVVLAVGLATLAVRRRDRVLAGAFVAGAAAFATATRLGGGGSWVAATLLGLLEAGCLVAIGAYVGVRRDLVASLRLRAEQAEGERELRAEQARLEERARIAHEMHDVLAHKVSLIAVHAGALEVLRSPSDEQVHDAAALIRTTARQAMEDLREVLGVLRSDRDDEGPDLAPQPGLADLERVVEASRAAGVQAHLQVEVADLPDAVARTVFRVVREGVANVHKHARDAATSVVVAGDEALGVTVEVVNQRPVASGSLLPGSGVGLLGLRERVSLLGGRLDAGPAPDGGWRLVAWLPWSVGHLAPTTTAAPTAATPPTVRTATP